MQTRSAHVGLCLRACVALCLTLLVSACGGSKAAKISQRTAVAAKPARTVALPAGVRGAAGVEPNGYVWVLAGHPGEATLSQLQLSNGGEAATVPVSADATSVAQSATGQIALGLSNASRASGAVTFLNAAAQRPKTVAVGAAVQDVAYGPSGRRVYVLNGGARSRSVTIIDGPTGKVTMTVGVPSGTVAVVPNAGETGVWALTATGNVSETSLATRKVETSFSVASPGIALARSPLGGTLYVLKGTATTANIAVVDTVTSAIKKVLPAAAHSVALGVSVNSNQIYDFVGSSKVGNVQIYDLR